MVKAPKKLIEVALPLDDINKAAAREKSIRHGHPSTLHLWWARRPLAAARAVLFAQMVNDTGGERGWGNYPGQTKEDAQKERERLFGIIRELVKWENANNEELLEEAFSEIKKSWVETCELNTGGAGFDPDRLPELHDPFAGGGAIPFEAQKLGLAAHASDLNPVAVTINKALLEIPSKFINAKPIGPTIESNIKNQRLDFDWKNAQGLAEDVRRYGHWVRERAYERFGKFYPKMKITEKLTAAYPELGDFKGKEVKVIAWIWCRTVKSPDLRFRHVDVPLISTFILSSKKGQERWLAPNVDGDTYSFSVCNGPIPDWGKLGTKQGRGSNFRCILSNSPIDSQYIKEQGKKGAIGKKLLAIVLEGKRGRLFVESDEKHEVIANEAVPNWAPKGELNHDPRAIWTPAYGLTTYESLFTDRQLVALAGFVDLIEEVRDKVLLDAIASGWTSDKCSLEEGGKNADAYADAIAVYLAMALSKLADSQNALVTWKPSMNQAIHLFTRQGIPMAWDFAESNIFSGMAGDFYVTLNNMMRVLDSTVYKQNGFVYQAAAQDQAISSQKVISTDPPYYDNIGYAILSDFFYVWMRRSLKSVFPKLFSTISVPKQDELVATPYRHGTKEQAEIFFMEGMTQALANIHNLGSKAFPVTIYYAFKQSDTKKAGTVSSGWETFLEAVIRSGFSVTGTWPMRTELGNRMVGRGTNALASSIVLVCRSRDVSAPSIPRRRFLRELKNELPDALEAMIGGKGGTTPIAPVDLAQAAIGPGMAVYSRYSGILEADGSKMNVHDALIQINKVIDEYFNEAESDMDADTRFCIEWFMSYGFSAAEFGQADVLARAKGTTVDSLATAGVVESGSGNVRLLKFEDYPSNWDPRKDNRTPVWEALHQLIRALREGGENASGELLAKMPERTESIRQLAYRLYTLCERKKWADEARAYNELIISWHGTVNAAEKQSVQQGPTEQHTLY